jgi:putative acetyltransferase
VTVEAFKTIEISKHTDQFLVEALRANNALRISLIAEVDGHVAGHFSFSPVTISDGTGNGTGLGLFRCCRNTSGKALENL